MGENFQFLEIIFFAMVAVFILLRLRNVLGRRTGSEQPTHPSFAKDQKDSRAADLTNVVKISDGSTLEDSADDEAESDSESSFHKLQKEDPTFDKEAFIKGASTAYDMILNSFSLGDTDTLRALLDDDVYDDFQRAIAERQSSEQTLETTLVSIKSADILHSNVKGMIAELTVKFVSETINVTRDSKENIVSGDPRAIQQVTDLWTFARDLRSADLNWKLIATRSEN